ncbi:SRPBCC family protein [Amycolatopsis arida]|uniref:SRPBCC family protein n=1 Tax=Amycolatopsis arida TaxID=587909 RepID=UPI001AB03417|nr:SRPBCC family protein [Amycolatopsis arida]
MTVESSQPAGETFRVGVDVEIDANPGTVFDYVADLPRSGEWSPECRGGDWVSGQPAAVGSVFRARNHRRPDVVAWAPVVRGEWTTECEIVESTRPSAFRWAMRDRAGRRQQSVWSFELRPGAAGGTVLTHAFWMGELTEGMRGILAELDDAGRRRFVAEWAEKLRDDMETSANRIRAAVERGGR